jgi:hypothetical protein
MIIDYCVDVSVDNPPRPAPGPARPRFDAVTRLTDGNPMGADHPHACSYHDGGRTFHTGSVTPGEDYHKWFQGMTLGAIKRTAGQTEANCSSYGEAFAVLEKQALSVNDVLAADLQAAKDTYLAGQHDVAVSRLNKFDTPCSKASNLDKRRALPTVTTLCAIGWGVSP